MVSEHQPSSAARRVLVRTLWIIAGTIGAILILFFCQDVFSGYPQYGTNILTYVGVGVFMAIAAWAWVIDHRRLDADEPDAGEALAGEALAGEALAGEAGAGEAGAGE